ncbi:hypothetical protein [Kitasatospora sp. NPDC092286]|uniref:hypothetical protein n=1 Tax=Kitasatospora sp. NPDC092286 TaxID=3364087 RepID=UPI00381F9907
MKVDLLGDAVDVVGDDVGEVHREGLAVAQTAAAHRVDHQEEGVVAGGAYRLELGWGGYDGALRVVLGRLDAVERVLVVEAEEVGVEEDRLQLVEGVGLGSEADAVALHGLDEGLDDLVVEGAYPAAAEGGVEVAGPVRRSSRRGATGRPPASARCTATTVPD